MAEGRCREGWNHTAALMALVANVNRDPKKSRVFRPDDFNPYRGRNAAKVGKASVKVLKDVFVRQKNSKEKKT